MPRKIVKIVPATMQNYALRLGLEPIYKVKTIGSRQNDQQNQQ